MKLQKRQRIEAEVTRVHLLTSIAVLTLPVFAGVKRRTWQGRRGIENRHNGHIPRNHRITPEEEAAIARYCQGRMEVGYRVLCWQMVDATIAAVAPATVYNVLKRKGLTKKWVQTKEVAKRGLDQPGSVHEQWHTDFAYMRICGVFY
jgi:ectoine hydroxylase-related dioxygenase (phytanoyl-CoA dioxygenase family)